METRQIKNAVKNLVVWFERQKRILPWRSNPSVYRVWISEIMLQQTQVVTVIPYFEKFISQFPKVERLAKAPEAQVMTFWAGLGYYSRARNLHLAAKQIVQMGRFPESRAEWLEIPGVGPYTAGAILSIAQNQVEPILDGNVERVLSRVFRVDRKKGDAHYKATLWSEAERWVTLASQLGLSPSALNQGLMELGATHCLPKKPKCEVCPLEKICEAHRSDQAELYPPRKARKSPVKMTENRVCVICSDKILLRKSEPGEWRAGLWDLPGENGVVKTFGKLLGQVKTQHVVTNHRITRTTKVYRVSPAAAAKIPKSLGTQWVKFQDLPGLAAGSALRKTIQEVSLKFQIVEL